MRHTFWILTVTVAITQFSTALPRFALMTGAKCASCHVNPTGGQMRTDYGSTFSTDVLPLRASRDEDFTFSGKLNDNISLGGDYRSQFIWDQFSAKTSFQSMTTAIYGAVKISKKFSFYFKQDIVNGSYNGVYGGLYNGTEAYGLAKPVSNWYLKGGLFLPDYGWRIDDHTAYTRGGDLGFTGAGYHQSLPFIPNYKDLGVEVGGYIENFFVSAGVFNGTGHLSPIDFSKDKAIAAKLEYASTISGANVRLGASGYAFGDFKMGGFTAGFSPDSCLAVYGEIDWTKNRYAYLFDTTFNVNYIGIVPNVYTMASFVEADLRLMDGLWFTGRYDMYDPSQGLSDDDSAPGTNSVQRVTLGLEFFPYSFVEVRPQFRFTLEKPSVSDNNIGFVQMHFWF